MRMKKIFFLIVVLSLSSTAFPQIEKAQDFVLPDLTGAPYKLSEHLGNGPVLINFWATWCFPCLEEMKKLKKIHNKFGADSLKIISISIDDPKTVGKVKSVINTNRMPFKILLDTNNNIFKLYQGTAPPFTLLLDKTGRIVYSHVGYRKGDEKKLERRIAELIKEDRSNAHKTN